MTKYEIKKSQYEQKFNTIHVTTHYADLQPKEKALTHKLAFEYFFTQQELRIFCESAVDLRLWGEPDITYWYHKVSSNINAGSHYKKKLFSILCEYRAKLQQQPLVYRDEQKTWPKKETLDIKVEQTNKKIAGMCPVASEKTVCCNLRTIDAVENCAFTCTYCAIEPFYEKKEIFFDKNFKQKLLDIKLDPSRNYHYGIGQSSDSLVWGNKHNILDDLMEFAHKNPNVLLEFKSKSSKIDYFLANDIPSNVLLSWSLNPQIVIDHEEHFTSSIKARLSAAKKIANKGIKISFHFHPIFYFDGFEKDYLEIIKNIMTEFDPHQILFISMGTLTFAKSTVKKIRRDSSKSQVLKMQMVKNPEGKFSYSEEIKNMIFKLVYDGFSNWHEKVFFYLCMEEAKFWQTLFGDYYKTNDDFESALLKASFDKL